MTNQIKLQIHITDIVEERSAIVEKKTIFCGLPTLRTSLEALWKLMDRRLFPPGT